jgi:hypothetical protein
MVVANIEISLRWKGQELCADALDALTQRASGKEHDLVMLFHQAAADR